MAAGRVSSHSPFVAIVVKHLACGHVPAISPSVFWAGLPGASHPSWAVVATESVACLPRIDCLWVVLMLFWLDYLGPLQNHVERDTCQQVAVKTRRLAKMFS